MVTNSKMTRLAQLSWQDI